MQVESGRNAAERKGWSLALIAMLLVMALVVSACGDDEEEPASGGGEAAQTEGSGQKAEGEPIVTYTFTDVNTQGPQYKNIEETARIYAEWINENGGIKGRPLDARFCDTRGTPTDAAACARKAVSDKAVAVVGSFNFTGDAYVPILEQGGITLFGNCCPIAPAEFTNEISYPMGNQPLYAVGLVKRAVEDGCKKINGVIIEGAETFRPLMENAAKGLNTKINKFITLPATARDYSPQVAEATSGGVDCLVMVVSETPYIAWMPAFSQSGSDARMYGPQGNLNEKVAKGHEQTTDGDVIAGMYPDIALPQWENFRNAIEKYEADDEQDYNSLGGMGTWAAYEGFKQVVEDSIEGDEVTNETFLEAVKTHKLSLPGMVPDPLDFGCPWSEDGAPEGFDRLYHRSVIFSTLKNGKLEPLTEEFEDVSELAGGEKSAPYTAGGTCGGGGE